MNRRFFIGVIGVLSFGLFGVKPVKASQQLRVVERVCILNRSAMHVSICSMKDLCVYDLFRFQDSPFNIYRVTGEPQCVDGIWRVACEEYHRKPVGCALAYEEYCRK